MPSYVPTGPWSIGVRDVSYYTGPGQLLPDGHLSARLFYPAARNTGESSSVSPIAASTSKSSKRGVLWTNAFNYAMGYAHYPFAFQQNKLLYQPLKFVMASVIWILGAGCRIPAQWNAQAAAPVVGAGAAPGTETTQSGQGKQAAGVTWNGNNNGSHISSSSGISSASNGYSTAAAAGVNGSAAQGPVHGFPVLLFSHGLAGQRNTYSCICTEMASHGFVVLALEHADGTASVAHLAGPGLSWEPNIPRETEAQARGRWRWFHGIGDRTKYTRRTKYRVGELQTALNLLRELHEGRVPQGLVISGPRGEAATFLRGRLDLARVAVAGHSFGGGTVTHAVASDPAFKCGIAMDPWWDSLPDGSPALEIWSTSSPLLVIGSHAWNTPDPNTGKIKCNGDLQEQVLAAAQMTGGGALLIVPRHSTHSSFDDILLLFGSNRLVQSIIKLVTPHKGPSTLSPERAHEINTRAMLRFLRHHLPDPTDLSDPKATAAAGKVPVAASLRIPAGQDSRPMAGLQEAAEAAWAAAAEAKAGEEKQGGASGGAKGVPLGEPKPLTPDCEPGYHEILGSDLETLVMASLNK